MTTRFRSEQAFPGASPRDVGALLVDPEFQSRVELPDLSLPEVVAHERDGDVTVLKLRYAYTGQLDPIARKLLGNRTLSWAQELRLDLRAGRGELTFAAEADPSRLHGRAEVTLRAEGDGDAGTRRRFDGELAVKAPVVGGMAERRIVPGLLRRLDVEADAVRAHLARPVP
ncbi:MAG TPA: DUF2505 family protein [Acidimicrobiia bacterium]|nr:DUF2505 family protein [Acidimicrobiia bacterium]